MSDPIFIEKKERAVSSLEKAILSIQQAQTFLKNAKRFGTLNGAERKIIDRVCINLIDPIDEIYAVREAQRIGIK